VEGIGFTADVALKIWRNSVLRIYTKDFLWSFIFPIKEGVRSRANRGK
jgi:hypothetical protein